MKCRKNSNKFYWENRIQKNTKIATFHNLKVALMLENGGPPPALEWFRYRLLYSREFPSYCSFLQYEDVFVAYMDLTLLMQSMGWRDCSNSITGPVLRVDSYIGCEGAVGKAEPGRSVSAWPSIVPSSANYRLQTAISLLSQHSHRERSSPAQLLARLHSIFSIMAYF